MKTIIHENHATKIVAVGSDLASGFYRVTCSCGWMGGSHWFHNDYAASNASLEAADHRNTERHQADATANQ